MTSSLSFAVYWSLRFEEDLRMLGLRIRANLRPAISDNHP